MELTLLRISETELGTHGVIFFGAHPALVSLELPWRENKKGISCIPEGTYAALPHISARFGWTIHILDVPGRSEILVHAGNTIADSRGCILPGMQYSDAGVASSRVAMKSLQAFVSAPIKISVRRAS
jgi:hypothetical protein